MGWVVGGICAVVIVVGGAMLLKGQKHQDKPPPE
jgi:hypothetical protein